MLSCSSILYSYTLGKSIITYICLLFIYIESLDFQRSYSALHRKFQILGSMKKDASSLMLSTVIKNLKALGYLLKVFFVRIISCVIILLVS